MPESFECPNCSAPLQVRGDGSATLRCPYCNSSVIIPADLRVATPGVPNSTNLTTAELEEKKRLIYAKVEAGEEIEAIKVLRETFRIDLLGAKSLVDTMRGGEDVDLTGLQARTNEQHDSPNLDPAMVQALVDLINSGNKMEAIKLYRENLGVGLKDAKEAIDGLEAGLSSKGEADDIEALLGTTSSTNLTRSGSVVKISKGGGTCIGIGIALFLLVTVVIPVLAALVSQGGPLAGVWARINPFAVGRVTMQFGQEGTGPGYFTDARFVSVDNNGHIYVGEFTGGRVQVFDEVGNYISQWNATGEVTGDVYLTGMAADRSGIVYTTVGSELYMYDGLTGNMVGKLEHPEGWGFDDVTVAPDGSIVAAWYKNKDDIIGYDQNGNIDLWIEYAISSITGDSELDMRVAVDGTGKIYTLAYFNEAVFTYTSDGKYISRFGSVGDEEGQFTSPRSIAIDNLGKVYIADFPGVMIYASDGRYRDTLSVNGPAMGLAFDDENNLYVVTDHNVIRYKLK